MATATDELIQTLRTAADWQERRHAALQLGTRPERGTFRALVSALGDRDPDVRHGVVLSLGRLGDARALDVLCRPWVLEDPSANIRWAAVTALGQLGSLSIANALSRALDDPEWVVRNQALLVMSDFIRRIPDHVDGDQIKSLIRLLAIPDAEVRSLVVDALARRSTRGLDEMAGALKGQSRVVRSGVAEALGLSQDPRAVAPLIEATRDPVGLVRREAARGLGRLGDPWAVESLIVLLGDSDSHTRHEAVNALVAIGSASVTPLCTALAHATSKVHRRHIIIALGGIADPRAVIPLLNNLSSTYFVVRRAAATALSAYGEQVVDSLVEMIEVSEVPFEGLVREILEQQNKRLRLRAIRAVGELKNAALLPPLRKVMEGADREVAETTQEALSKIGLAAWARHGAVIALGNIGVRRAIPALVKALHDHSEYVRGEAARALAKMPDNSAVTPLIRVIGGDRHPWVRREAVAALRVVAEPTPEVIEVLCAALQDASWEVRAEAARAVGRLDDASAVGLLLAALEDPSYTVMTSAVHALANLEKYAVPELLAIAAGQDSARREPALWALGEAAAEETRAEVEALHDCPVEERAARVEQLEKHWR